MPTGGPGKMSYTTYPEVTIEPENRRFADDQGNGVETQKPVQTSPAVSLPVIPKTCLISFAVRAGQYLGPLTLDNETGGRTYARAHEVDAARNPPQVEV